MVTATFRDEIGTFMIEDIANIQYDVKDKTYSVMHSDYETEEIIGQLVEINVEGF